MTTRLLWRGLALGLIACTFGFAFEASAQQFDSSMFQHLRWRGIGPYRGGRTKSITGVPGQPNVFYMGVVNGGVWKTTDYGRTWQPIFDDQPTGSIGAVAVAPADANTIYVGSGEGLHRPDLSVGDGIYKSTDAGKTWAHLGLRDGQQIPNIAIDPRNANHILVAVAGHPYGPNQERGIFNSTDGGQTFQKVLYKDENTGGADVKFDPQNPDTAYATLWEAREGAWENGAWNGTGGGIYKSTDGGKSWRQLTKGLPEGIIQANIAIAPSNPQRIYSSVASMVSTPPVLAAASEPGANAQSASTQGVNSQTKGVPPPAAPAKAAAALAPAPATPPAPTASKVNIYRSDDGGESWSVATDDDRPAGRIGGGDLSVPRVDTKNPDVVYVASTVTWKSTDGGKTWTGFRGAPGGDDYQNVWINPDNPQIIALASDQGAIISVNGGESWSSWYNQSTAQMYHVNADNVFPYRLCSGQQESGSACVASRGNDGEITFREWHPVAAEEYGYVVPDPSDPDVIFGGKLTRYDRRTNQAQNILPKPFRGPDFRMLRTEPIVFSPKDPHTLYFATNNLWKTSDGGQKWQQISPDLTRKTFEVPTSIGKYRNEPSAKATQRGVIYAVAISPLDEKRIWAGTDDGLIHLTTDGGANWKDITPPQLAPFTKVSIIEASHYDAPTAYAAINTLRLDDLRPHIFRTRDSGANWTEIVNGIPNGENVNVVREDPHRKGLLFAGTERAVYVSFDDGDHWQSLRLNMPATSVRDVIIKRNDLVAATHGRGFWILDDISALYQLDKVSSAPATLFQPEAATRVRWSMNTDTPLPPDVAAGENPPDGAIIDYYLKSGASGPVTLEIRDSAGKTVRKYSSDDPVQPIDPKLEIPTYWVRPQQILSSAAGTHRFLWDLHYPPISSVKPTYPIAAVYRNTSPDATSPWVMPGSYTVVLTANGQSYSKPLMVEMDPRVKASAADLALQFKLSERVYQWAGHAADALEKIAGLRSRMKDLQDHHPRARESASALKSLDDKLQALEGGETGRGGRGNDPKSMTALRTSLLALMGVFQEADVAPSTQAAAAVGDLQRAMVPLWDRWQAIQSQDIPAVNAQLRSASAPELTVSVSGENAKH